MYSVQIKTIQDMGNHAEPIDLMINVSDELIDELIIKVSEAKKDIGLPMAILHTDKIVIQMIVR
jgi:hypothetical protein